MTKFPLTVIDNFFDDPYRIIEIAKTLEYFDQDAISNNPGKEVWPGLRTRELTVVAPDVEKLIAQKIMALYYSQKLANVNIAMNSCFQLRPAQSYPDYEHGFVHVDESQYNLAGLIYLSPNADPDTGTSIMEPNGIHVGNEELVSEDVRQLYYRKKLTSEQLQQVIQAKQESEGSVFRETVTIKNKFNRFIMYDAGTFHRTNKLNGNTDRLTLVFFCNVISTTFPILDIKQVR